MNRYKKALNSLYNGFMPVSQIKGTLIIVVGLYLVFLGLHIKDNLNMQREVPVENVHQNGTVSMNGINYPVSESKESALIPLKIENPVQFLFISSGIMDESMFSALLKIFTGLLLLRLLGQIDLTDPFNPDHYKLVNKVAWLSLVIIVTAYFKEFYTAQWFKATYHYASGFKYTWGYSLFYLIPALWILRATTVFYKSAVLTRQETEFTV